MRQHLLLFSSLLWVACDCGASPTPGRPCVSAADCASGQVCIDGTCQDTPSADGGRPLDGSACGPEPWQTGVEVCDGLDNDCDGVIDNGVLSPCGDCNPSCQLDGFGPGGAPFEPTPENSDGVSVDAEGALVLDSRRINTNFIWIANTTEGSVSRFSTTAPYPEVGRYLTGPMGFAGAHFAGNDPSRTSVNTVGDAYVGNRNGNRITRISVLGGACPDTNGDGVITTSQDLNGDGIISSDPAAGEMLPFGQDDCVLWSRFLDDVLPGENLVRAVAAQDVEGPDGELIEYVWVGGWATSRAAKIDGRTGEPVLVTDSPTNPYGFALDGNGQLWVSGPNGAGAGRLDTTRCIDAASCMVEVCQASGPEGTECDSAVKARIPLPGFIPYGITVDFEQRVWIGGYTTPRPGGGTYVPWYGRYVPTAPPGSRWTAVHLPSIGIDFDHVVNGIAADARGFVYGAGWTGGVIRIDANAPTNAVAIAGTGGLGNKGMAIDAEGKVWSVTMNNQAVVVEPGATLAENTVTTGVATSTVGSYTYSDMTGLQLRLATNPRGHYRHLLEACEEPITPDWDELRFEVEAPAGTTVSFRVKTSDTREALEALEWIPVGSVPPSGSPLSISDALMRAGVAPARFLWVEVVLQAERSSSTEVITPRVLGFDVTHSCPPIFE